MYCGMETQGESDYKQVSKKARERLISELAELDRVNRETTRKHAGQLADGGLDPLRRMSAELVERAIDLHQEITRLEELAKEAAKALGPGPAAARPVEIRPAVRVIVEQLRLAGELDAEIESRLLNMGVDDPEAVLAQVGG
jgi:hypothetical protein